MNPLAVAGALRETEVLDETRRLFGPIAERPFAHQREACALARHRRWLTVEWLPF